MLETDRLRLREITLDDAAFMLRLLNEPSFLENIGDRGVRTLDDARRYISDGPRASYARHGFGLYLVETRGEAVPIGICGLLKRDTLPHVDVGYALVPEHWSRGYAREAVSAVLAFARDHLLLTRVVAITNPQNARSIGLLEKLGFRFERTVRVNAAEPEVQVHAIDF